MLRNWLRNWLQIPPEPRHGWLQEEILLISVEIGALKGALTRAGVDSQAFEAARNQRLHTLVDAGELPPDVLPLSQREPRSPGASE